MGFRWFERSTDKTGNSEDKRHRLKPKNEVGRIFVENVSLHCLRYPPSLSRSEHCKEACDLILENHSHLQRLSQAYNNLTIHACNDLSARVYNDLSIQVYSGLSTQGDSDLNVELSNDLGRKRDNGR